MKKTTLPPHSFQCDHCVDVVTVPLQTSPTKSGGVVQQWFKPGSCMQINVKWQHTVFDNLCNFVVKPFQSCNTLVHNVVLFHWAGFKCLTSLQTQGDWFLQVAFLDHILSSQCYLKQHTHANTLLYAVLTKGLKDWICSMQCMINSANDWIWYSAFLFLFFFFWKLDCHKINNTCISTLSLMHAICKVTSN